MFSQKIKVSKTCIISLLMISGIGITLAATFQFSGTTGVAHNYGQFYSGTDNFGNAGIVSFSSGGDARLNGDKLEGSFDIETLGRAYFNSDAMILPPTSGLITDLWTATGTISSSGGTIYLQSGSTYNVQYNPVTRKLIGDGWNIGVGRVPFGIAGSSIKIIDGVKTTDDTGIDGSGSVGFVGRVKVLGNVGGNKAYDTLNPLGAKFNASIMNDNLNKIRKNVALLTRNIPSVYMNASFNAISYTKLENKVFYINTGSTIKTLIYTGATSSLPLSLHDSLIIIGGDLIIDADMINGSNNAKGIIVLKNDKGVGGNIIITKNVKKIQASMFTEGSIYSGDDLTNLYNDTTAEVALLSRDITNQLYIIGSIMSRNTIGGSVQATTPVCPYNIACDNTTAIRYDLNYFRSYASGSTSERAFTTDKWDDFSVIIEMDPRFISAPPPGFEMK